MTSVIVYLQAYLKCLPKKLNKCIGFGKIHWHQYFRDIFLYDTNETNLESYNRIQTLLSHTLFLSSSEQLFSGQRIE